MNTGFKIQQLKILFNFIYVDKEFKNIDILRQISSCQPDIILSACIRDCATYICLCQGLSALLSPVNNVSGTVLHTSACVRDCQPYFLLSACVRDYIFSSSFVRDCAKILGNRCWESESQKQHFESGVNMGVGSFNLVS